MTGGEEADLQQHLAEHHASEFQPLLEEGDAPERMMCFYQEAVSHACRRQAPLAGSSLDRTALSTFATALANDNIEALICASCACVHTYAQDNKAGTGIQWEKPLDYSTDDGEHFQFLGQPVQNVATLLGLENFLKAYDILDKVGAAKISNHESFESWKLSIPMPSSDDGQVDILCCPEARHHAPGCPTHVQKRHIPHTCLDFKALKKQAKTQTASRIRSPSTHFLAGPSVPREPGARGHEDPLPRMRNTALPSMQRAPSIRQPAPTFSGQRHVHRLRAKKDL